MMAASAHLQQSQKPSGPAPAITGKVHYPFWFGGSASCFAAGVTHPLDLGKTRFPAIEVWLWIVLIWIFCS